MDRFVSFLSLSLAHPSPPLVYSTKNHGPTLTDCNCDSSILGERSHEWKTRSVRVVKIPAQAWSNFSKRPKFSLALIIRTTNYILILKSRKWITTRDGRTREFLNNIFHFFLLLIILPLLLLCRGKHCTPFSFVSFFYSFLFLNSVALSRTIRVPRSCACIANH